MATSPTSKLALSKAIHSPRKSKSAPKSPIKKAMQVAFNWEQDPQPEGEHSGEDDRTLFRSELLQKVLSLLDQEDSVVDFVASVVDRVSTIPLEDATVRTAFLAQLQDVKSRATIPSSGRTRCLNVQSCRAFILACANEVVDLDENDPSFDYAETCVDSEEVRDAAHAQVLMHPLPPGHEGQLDYAESLSSCSAENRPIEGNLANRLRRVFRQHYDYASNAPTLSQCSSECERDDCLQSAFSRLHSHAAEMAQKRLIFAEFKQQMPMNLQNSPLKSPEKKTSKQSPVKEYATKYRSFEALRINRNNSPLNMGRKKKAFYKFKTSEDIKNRPTQHISIQPIHTPSWHASPLTKDYLLSLLIVAIGFILLDELHLW